METRAKRRVNVVGMGKCPRLLHVRKRSCGLGWVLAFCFILWVSLPSCSYGQQENQKATEQLGKALDYFMSKKYHECLMLMSDLDKHYRLNPRYKAYLGLCYYYEWDYKNAVKYLDAAIPQLVNFSPRERSVYYWADAESYFYLQEYANAIPLYQSMLSVCYDNEKPDAYYRLGFCHLFLEEWNEAWNALLQAQEGYRLYRNTPDMKARMVQIDHMLDGLKPKVVGNVIDHLLKK